MAVNGDSCCTVLILICDLRDGEEVSEGVARERRF